MSAINLGSIQIGAKAPITPPPEWELSVEYYPAESGHIAERDTARIRVAHSGNTMSLSGPLYKEEVAKLLRLFTALNDAMVR